MPTDKEPDLAAQDAADPQSQDEASESNPTPAYEVGYRKPPKHTRFKPGESGNKKGRPKGHRNFKTDLLEELQEKITIRERGKTKKVTRQRAYVKKLFNDAMGNNARGSNLMLSAIARFHEPEALDLDVQSELSNDDQAILDDFKRRLRKQIESDQDAAAAPEATPPEETQ